MKNIILIIVLLLSVYNYANAKCKQSKKLKNNDSISISFIDPYLFKNLPYYLQISIKDTNNLVIESDGISIHKENNGIYAVNGKYSSYLNIYRINDTVKTKIFSKFLQFRELPISLFLNGKYPNMLIKFNDFKNANFQATLLNYNIEIGYPILSIKMSALLNDSIVDITSNSNNISNDQYELISKIKDKTIPVSFIAEIDLGNGSTKLLEPVIYYISKESK